MKAFVTGSTGLLGNNLVRELLAQGHEVRALVRSRAKAEALFGDLPIEYVVGDMEDVAGFAAALEGCDALFHTAAFFREYYAPGDHWQTLERINITATIELFRAAQAHGLSRIIHTSSSGVIDGAVRNESSGPNPHAERNLYFRSKVLGDARIAELVRDEQTPVVTILPGWMLGPGDLAPTASGQLVLDFVHGKLPGTFDGGTSTVDARDVAGAMISAVDKGQIGERYIVGGEYVSMRQLVEGLRAVSGLKGAERRFPNGLMLLLATLLELGARFTGKAPLISREGVKTMMDKHRVESGKAMRELGVSFRPLRETLSDELHWYAEAGRIAPDISLKRKNGQTRAGALAS